MAYEALAWGKYVNDYEHAHRLVEPVDHPNLGTCLDSFHILSRDWDTAPIEAFNPEKIFFVQVADAPKLSMDVLSWSRHYRVFPGEGQFELAKFMGHVVRAGYTGPVSLEVFNDVFRQSDVERTAVDAMRSLIWLEEQSAKWLDAHPLAGTAAGPRAAPAAAATRWSWPRCRGWPNPPGSTSPRSAPRTPPRWRPCWASWASRFNGRHRTQECATLDHGPRTRDHQRGRARPPAETAIAAVGFDVDSPVIAAARAQQLKAPAVPRKSQADEEVFQGFAAPDSTEIFLCQGSPDGTAAWVDEFGPGHAEPATGGEADGARAVIDHVNLAQPWQHFDEAVLFYTSALALQPQPYAEVASPTGLVRSQVMPTGDRGVRLVLNLAPLHPAGGRHGAGRRGLHAAPDLPGAHRVRRR